MKSKISSFLLLTSFGIIACSTQPKYSPAKEVAVREDFYPYYNGSMNEPNINIYQLQWVLPAVETKLAVIDDINLLLVDKSFSSAQIFPEGSLFRKRIHTFTTAEVINEKYNIKTELTKDERYASYKLIIKAIDTKTKQPKNRQWLFADDLSQEQLAIRIAKTIIKYSFQEL